MVPLSICSLNSGSNGNSYYIGNSEEAILVDAGISCREIEKRMKRLGLKIEMVKAIFISHEHADHINGVPVLSKKYQIPVYITAATLRGGRISIEPHLLFSFAAYQPLQIGGLRITAFPKFHDANDPHSFIIASQSVTIGVFTDIGASCKHLIHHFQQCNAAFLEANYDAGMLENGSYPRHLKNRISGGKGHLSNEEALQLFLDYRPDFMTHLFLSHLSKNNNDPDIACNLFRKHASHTQFVLASRYKETAVFQISHDGSQKPVPAKPTLPAKQLQLSLF